MNYYLEYSFWGSQLCYRQSDGSWLGQVGYLTETLPTLMPVVP